MKKLITYALVGLALIGWLQMAVAALVVLAGDTTVTTTAGQDTYIQNVVIPQVNVDRCARWGLPPTCNTADVQAKGCVANPLASLTKDNPIFVTCTIYTQNTAGVNAFKIDGAAQGISSRVLEEITDDVRQTCVAWKASNAAAKGNSCTAIGRPSTCAYYRPGGC